MTQKKKRAVKLAAPFAVVLVACAIFSVGDVCSAADESITDIDKKIIVDCFLGRGTIRRTGGALSVRPVPGQHVRISKLECDTRNGESILYDAADPRTALQLWSGPAKDGDPEAQNRLGQIYELGIGTEPDYNEAAKFYRRAADAGSRAAALNLASLYDRGLGVAKDPAKAKQYYVTASGGKAARNTDDVATFARKLEASRREIDQLDLKVLTASTDSKAATEAEAARKKWETAMRTDVSGSPFVLMDVGPDAGSRPTITLVDPNLVSTRGLDRVVVPDNVRSREIVGRVRARNGVSTVRVNDIVAATDRLGFFSVRVPVQTAGSRVEIVAVDRKGVRETRSFFLQPNTATSNVDVRSPRSETKTRFGNYYALVIGNHRYGARRSNEPTSPGARDDWPDLANAERDARAVASLLQRKYSFTRVQLMIDGTHDQILNAVNAYVSELDSSDNLLIYYAGHGQFDLGKRGYWIPVDAETQRNTRWIVNLQITDLLSKMRARKVLIVSDSCYGGAMAAAENGAVATLRTGLTDAVRIDGAPPMVDARSRVLLASGFLSPVPDAGGVDHSLFAQALLDVLGANSGVMEGFQLFAAVEARMLYAARSRVRDHSPVYAAIAHAGHEGGDFFFVPTPSSR